MVMIYTCSINIRYEKKDETYIKEIYFLFILFLFDKHESRYFLALVLDGSLNGLVTIHYPLAYLYQQYPNQNNIITTNKEEEKTIGQIHL